MSEIEYGAKVRAITEGEYAGRDDHGNHLVRTRAALSVLPSTAEVAVLSLPLPPEPPVGAYVLVGPEVYRRDFGGWQHVGFRSSPLRWEQIWEAQPVVRLYREDEQPQEKYEPVPGSDGFGKWLHDCGHVQGWRLGSDPEQEEGTCHRCTSANSNWTRLYRRSSDDR